MKEFREHFFFAVNQPNEKELVEIIEKEIEKDNLISTDKELFYCCFLTEALNWFKEYEKDQNDKKRKR